MCITLVLGCWHGSFVVGCVISTTCSEVPTTWVFRRCRVGGPAILRVYIWRRFRAETLHPLQSFRHISNYSELNISLYRKVFVPFKRGVILFFKQLKGKISFKYPNSLFYSLCSTEKEFHIIFQYLLKHC